MTIEEYVDMEIETGAFNEDYRRTIIFTLTGIIDCVIQECKDSCNRYLNDTPHENISRRQLIDNFPTSQDIKI